MSEENERMVSIGRVRRAVGLDGRVEVELYSRAADGNSAGDIESLSTGAVFFTAGEAGRSLTVERVSSGRKGRIAVKFKEVSDRDAADKIRGADLEVLESALAPLPEGVYYHYQLIGSTVIDTSGRQIGTLSGIMETGSNDVYMVTTDEGQEILIPATRDTVKEVDTVRMVVTVESPDAIAGPDPGE